MQGVGTHFFPNAQDVDIGPFSVNSAGRDIVTVTNHYYGGGVASDCAWTRSVLAEPHSLPKYSSYLTRRERLRGMIRAWLGGPTFLDIYQASIAQRTEETGVVHSVGRVSRISGEKRRHPLGHWNA